MRRPTTRRRRSLAAVVLLNLLAVTTAIAQPRIASFRPDAAAPGMAVVVEILAPASQAGAFGFDGLLPSATRFILEQARDSDRVVVGPVQVAWNGRLLQVPLFVLSQATPGAIPFHITSPAGTTQTDTFYIQSPQHLGTLSGGITLGDGAPARLTKGNTIVVDSLILNSAFANLSLASPDSQAGNRRYLPLTILSRGPIRISASEFSVSAHGLDGGPGGAGGGHGHAGVGGAGYTGGGNSSAEPSTNIGSGGAATDSTGGPSLTGVFGGQSEKSDQGGGGGTGHPFGTSGRAGIGADTSRAGGYGGGSGGGELAPQIRAYGGGGGGHSKPGGNGEGVGANGGRVVGGRFLMPLAGGSGGGAGNALNENSDAGSGGGGGGAIALITYDSLIATDATISAAGDSGTSGASLTAGGGGGAGGAILLETARGGVGVNFAASVSGGSGGQGGAQGGRGGDGGAGRIRIDGPIDNCACSSALQLAARGISVFPDTAQQKASFVYVHGVPSAPQLSSDTVRIFYRTRHTGWLYVDTVRYVDNGPLRWSKWLPAFHDSIVFVAAYAQVLAPSRDPFNYEPDWLPSHVSLATMRHRASPNLIVTDSFWYGSIRRGHCKDAWIVIRNQGELPLVVAAADLSGDGSFSVITALPKTIAAYSVDSVLVRFCGETLGPHAARLIFRSNDSTRSIGIGGLVRERSDSIVFVPPSVQFNRVTVGACDSLDVKAFTRGLDTVHIYGRSFSANGFTLRLLSSDTALAPGDTAKFRVYFCADDTNTHNTDFAVAPRGDTLHAVGRGVIRLFGLTGGFDSIAVCGFSPLVLVDTLWNFGNDTSTLLRVTARRGLWTSATVTPARLPRALQIVWSATDPIGGTDTLDYIFSDTTIRHVVTFHRTNLSLDVPGDLQFDALCVNECDSLALPVSNTSADPIHLSASIAGIFSASFDAVLAPHSVDSIRIQFCPNSADGFHDTLRVRASSGPCDSIVTIALSGIGTVSPIVLDTLRFDSVILGTCEVDSITISNPCGPDVTITAAQTFAPFTIISSQVPLVVPSRQKRKLAIRFCPLKGDAVSAVIELTTESGDKFSAAIFGIGYDTSRVERELAIRLTPLTVVAGETARMDILLDSTNLIGRHSLSTTVAFDPTVAYPRDVTLPFSLSARWRDSIRIVSDLDLAQRGVIGSIEWLGLLGPHASTAVTATWSVDSLPAVVNSSSHIDVLDCSGLAGRIVPPGEFAVSEAAVDASIVRFELQMGVEGPLAMTAFDDVGRVTLRRSLNLSSGRHWIDLPVGDLPSGVQTIMFYSNGWKAVRRLVVLK